MQYFSWRIEAPWILNLCHFISKLAACWAYALVRHLEAYLKLKGKLSEQDYLSFQDFINKVPKDLIKGDGDISRIDDLADVVVNKGVVLKELCPMSNSLEEEPVKTVSFLPLSIIISFNCLPSQNNFTVFVLGWKVTQRERDECSR